MDARRARRHLGFLLRRHRRIVAALLAFIAVVFTLSALRPPPPPSMLALGAARDLPAGTLLSPDDLAPVEIPRDHAPPGLIVDAQAATGRTLSAPLQAGELLTRTRLTDAAVSYERGTLAVPVRLADSDMAALLAPGMIIDIVRGVGDEVDVVATGVRVITVPRRPAAPTFTGSGSGTTGSLVLVAADRPTANRLAAVGTDGDLAAILR